MKSRAIMSFALGITVLVASCGSDDSADTPTTASALPSTDASTPSGVSIEGAWARTSPMMATAGAAYMTITSPVDDRLSGASVDASVAATVEIHETVMGGDMGGDMGGSTGDTMMGGSAPATSEPTMMMQPVDGIDLPAGTAVELKPGGYHIMLLDLPAPLEIGQVITITLTFDKAGTVEVPVTVADEAP
jgi:copper(I)-binding protein